MIIPDFSDAKALELLANYRNTHVKVNRKAFRSGIDGDEWIDLYVDPRAASAYEQVGVIMDQTRSFPVGGLIVREVMDSKGALVKITAAAKGPAGYNPDCGDLWFAVADSTGKIQSNTAGQPMHGTMRECWSCHVGMKESGYFYGIPPDAKW